MKRNTTTKSKPEEVSEFFETDYGNRKVSHINQSRMIAIPKMALKNVCGTSDDLTVNVSMVQKGKERFLKLVPVCKIVSDEKTNDKDLEDGDE